MPSPCFGIVCGNSVCFRDMYSGVGVGIDDRLDIVFGRRDSP
jgi:hypothetical protein